MKRFFIILMSSLCCSGVSVASSYEAPYRYEAASIPWQESFGNHRAVLKIDKATEVAALSFDWRRGDREVDKRRFLIVNAETGDTVPNIKRLEVSDEKCELLFGPVARAGIYYFYYLPYQVQAGHGFYGGDYLSPEPSPEAGWLAKALSLKKYGHAQVERVESRTAFDSFYPMEIAATAAEKNLYLTNNPAGLYVFPEDRKFPVRMRRQIPMRWLDRKQGTGFRGMAAPNEYYAFQLAVWAPQAAVNQVSYRASSLRSEKGEIDASAITCFNIEGVDPYGTPFKKEINIPQGQVQSLWFGVDVPSDCPEGIYKGSILLTDGDGNKREVPVELTVSGAVLADRGDGELWRHSRLRWLNSTLGIGDTPTKPYTNLEVNGETIDCLGRQVTLDPATALPARISAWGTDILAAPVRFVIRTSTGEKQLKATFRLKEQTGGHIAGAWTADDGELKVSCVFRMEFDGWVNYVYTLDAKTRVAVEDIRLEIPFRKEVASYFLGAGLPGQDMPQVYEGKWDAPEKTVNNFGVSIPTSKEVAWLWPFDSFWTGNARAGIHCELRGSSYTGPLLNLYRPAYPESWFNGGLGGFSVKRDSSVANVVAYSGKRFLEPGQPLTFDFALLVTPVKPIDFEKQFVNRYYHNGGKPVPTDADVKAGVKIINIHHANEYNPFINYPFLTVDKMKRFTQEWHRKGCKVKLYYTLRELTNTVTELWAMRSLGHEILRGGNGGGFPWCREHLVEDYTPQWYHHFTDVKDTGVAADAALLTAESDSRWYNYYVEGLAWLVKNLDIDGIYLDDVSFDRRILKRMRRAMESVKPDCLIDLHSNTGFSKGPANQYTEFFPYVDKLWFGESFLYDKMSPANWLVEASGIPFGLTSDMLHRGGNKWLGMQYGMTVRHPWETEGVVCDPRLVWTVWDAFGIQDAQVDGFWEKNPFVTASDPDVKVTAYLKKDGRLLVSVGNYSDKVKRVRLQVGKQPELPAVTRWIAPEIYSFQKAAEGNLTEEIEIQPRKGWLLYLQ